ncbi:MAG TPA: VWA domain-containing protein [Bryobacteraceae bacterium]|nr:VWA domain-containing protein [Bryobacteraceae bacterium]
MRLFACWLALFAGCAAVCRQAPQGATTQNAPEMSSHDSAPNFSSKVNLVLVPVVVRDRTGKAVGNLTKDDFRLFDKSKPQVIARFSLEASSKTAKLPPSAETPTGAEHSVESNPALAEMPERYVAYVFDDLNIQFGDLVRVQQAAQKHFAGHLQPTDRAAIFSTSGQTTLDFTSDRPKLQDTLMRIRVNSMFGVTPNQCPDLSYYMADLIQNKNDQIALQAETQETLACAHMDSSQAAIARQLVLNAASRVLSTSEQGTRITLGVLKDVIRRMAAMPGQRLVVIVSPGFLTLNSESVELKTELLDRAARENVVISSLDARGLYTDSTYDASKQGSYTAQGAIVKAQYDRASDSAQADVLAEMADGTGGTFFQNSNDLLAGLNRVAAVPEFVYLLGFSPTNLKSDGSFHKLKVALANNTGLSVQARRGYFAPKHPNNPEDVAKTEIEDAVFSREEMHDMPVDLHTQFFKPDPADAKLTVLARVDLKHLRFKKAEGRNENNLTVVSVVFDRDGKYVTGMRKVIEMKLKDETLDRLNNGITVKSNFDVKPGTYLVRLVVRDTEGQMMAATNGAVDIP